MFAKVFTPAGFNIACDQKYVNNAGYVLNYSLVHSLCERKSSSIMSSMQDVSLMSSHGTMHSNIVHSLDELHNRWVGSESFSRSISMHDNSYSIFFNNNNFNSTLNEIFSGAFSYITEVLHNELDIYMSGNDTIPCDCNGSLLCSSPSLVDGEGWSYAGSILACANAEVVSDISGHPSVLVEITQREECVVKSTLL